MFAKCRVPIILLSHVWYLIHGYHEEDFLFALRENSRPCQPFFEGEAGTLSPNNNGYIWDAILECTERLRGPTPIQSRTSRSGA
jgi:hypothetical protein